jgi:hypothetical protein
MTKIVYVDPANSRIEVDVADGTSIMQGAVANGVDGIVAECGGNAMCERVMSTSNRREARIYRLSRARRKHFSTELLLSGNQTAA